MRKSADIFGGRSARVLEKGAPGWLIRIPKTRDVMVKFRDWNGTFKSGMLKNFENFLKILVIFSKIFGYF